MGVYSSGGGRGGSNDDNDDDSGHRDDGQAGLDDFDDQEEDDETGAAAGVASGAAAGTGASGATSVAGTAGVAAPIVDETIDSGDDGEDCDDDGTDSGEECEEEAEDAPELEYELEDLEQTDSDRDDRYEHEEEQEEREEPETEREEDDEEVEAEGDEDEDEEEDDNEEEDVVVTITTDPISAMTWGIQPVLKRVQERYDVEIEYRLAPVRTFDDPGKIREQWAASTEYHSMPVDLSFWDNPPKSTELLNRAVLAAERQGAGVTYLRLLWIRGIAGGETLSDERTLTSVAHQLGLDTDQFRADLADVEVPRGTVPDELPVTEVPIKGYTQRWEGYVHYVDFQQQFVFECLVEEQPRSLTSFVADHGPVTTEEVMETYQWNRGHTVSTLQALSGVSRVQLGQGEFWQ